MAKSTEAQSDTIIDDDDSEALFTYDESLEQAEAPDPLPENKYRGEITDVRIGQSQLSGKDQLIFTLVIPPENFPVDFNPENAPDGVRLLFYSRDVDGSRVGRYEMRRICEALKVPLTNRVRRSDFENKAVEIEVTHKVRDDGSTMMVVKGYPRAVG